MHLHDILFDLGEDREKYFNAITPPLIQSANFSFDSVEDFKRAINSEHSAHVYGRGNNPTVDILRKKMAALENAEDALIVGSGAAAMSLAVLSQVVSGDHIICVRNPYNWTAVLLQSLLPGFQVTHTFVEGSDIQEIENAVQPNTKLLILESPNSLTYGIQDMRVCATLCEKHNIISIMDNSWATPLFQKPIDHGIDIVIHSMSKYLNGHSDVVSGAICASAEIIEKIFYSTYMTLGPAVSPNDASLMLRGLRTLELRMQRIRSTTLQLLEFFKQWDAVTRIWYPLDPEFDQFTLASKQMLGGSGLITIALDLPDISSMNAFANALSRFKMAVSWGGHESLALPMSVLYGLEGRQDPEVPWNVMRLSMGLESAELLIADLNQAWATATK